MTAKMGKSMLVAALWLIGGCHSPGPCFGLRDGATYSITVVSRYDEKSPFITTGSSYMNGANTCGAALALMDGFSFDVTVVAQNSLDGECAGSLVSVASFPKVEFTKAFTYDRTAGTPANGIFAAFNDAKIGSCVGGWNLDVYAIGQEPEGGDPFRSSVPGQDPAVVMGIGFEAATDRDPACASVIPSLASYGKCIDYYVVQVAAK